MLIPVLRKIFNRDFNKLSKEIKLYKNEENLWKVKEGIINSGGNLCLHLLGNSKAFIGAELGNTGYLRNRPLEFSQKYIPASELLIQIEETKIIVDNTLASLTAEKLQLNYPLEVFNEKMTTEFFLVHLATHLNYHVGQLNYHRRLMDKVE